MGKWAKSQSFEDSNPGTVEIRAVCNISKAVGTVPHNTAQCGAVQCCTVQCNIVNL